MKYITLFDPLYQVELHLIWLCDQLEGGIKMMQLTGNDDVEDLAFYIRPENRGKFVMARRVEELASSEEFFFMLWMKDLEWSSANMGLLAHEVLHFVEAVFEMIGIPLSSETKEARAYYMQFWVSMIWHEVSDLEKQEEKFHSVTP